MLKSLCDGSKPKTRGSCGSKCLDDDKLNGERKTENQMVELGNLTCDYLGSGAQQDSREKAEGSMGGRGKMGDGIKFGLTWQMARWKMERIEAKLN